jgi:hypothetical protein
MKTLRTIHHKKNEIQEVEFFKDAECTEDFDFMDKKDLYIGGLNGDITPLVRLRNQAATWQNIYTPYLCEQFKYYEPLDKIKTLNDITPNLSKYIPEDNAVLFLREEEYRKYCNQFKPTKLIGWLDNTDFDYKDWFQKYNIKTATIFLTHGTQSELQKANEVAKYLWENFGIKPDLCVLHCFVNQDFILNIYGNSLEDSCLNEALCNFNKIITTNSTGILPVQDTERFKVIDAKEIFEDSLKTQR